MANRVLACVRPRAGTFPALLIFFLLGISQSSIGPLLPLFADRFEGSGAHAALLITAYFAGALTAMITVAVSRLPALVFLPGSIGAYSLGSAGLFFADHVALSLVCTTLAGFGAGSLILNINATFARQRRGVVLVNLLNGVFALGTIAGPLLAGASLDLAKPYGFLVVTVGAVFCFRVSRVATWPGGAGESAGDNGRKRVSRRVVAGFLGLYACYGGLETGIGGWAATHVRDQGFSAPESARIVALFWAATAVSKFAVLVLAPRFSASFLVTAGLVGAASSLALAASSNGAIIGYVLAGLALGPIFPTGLVWIAQAGGGRRITGMATSLSMTGSIAFPTLIGWSLTTNGTVAIPLILTSIGWCAVAASIWTHKSTRRQLGDTEQAKRATTFN